MLTFPLKELLDAREQITKQSRLDEAQALIAKLCGPRRISSWKRNVTYTELSGALGVWTQAARDGANSTVSDWVRGVRVPAVMAVRLLRWIDSGQMVLTFPEGRSRSGRIGGQRRRLVTLMPTPPFIISTAEDYLAIGKPILALKLVAKWWPHVYPKHVVKMTKSFLIVRNAKTNKRVAKTPLVGFRGRSAGTEIAMSEMWSLIGILAKESEVDRDKA